MTIKIGDIVRIKKTILPSFRRRYPKDHIPAYAQRLVDVALQNKPYKVMKMVQNPGSPFFYCWIENLKNAQDGWVLEASKLTPRGPFVS